MRRSHKNEQQLSTLLRAAGVDPLLFKEFIEQSIEIELAVLYANQHKIPDNIYLHKKRAMISARTVALMID